MDQGHRTVPWRRSAALLVVIWSTACLSANPTPAADPSLDLANPVENMTGAQLWDALAGIVWAHGPEDDRRCGDDGDNACHARFDMAYIVRGAQVLRPDPWNATSNGTIVGRIVNTGSRRWGMDVGRELRYSVPKRGGQRHFVVIATNRQGTREYWVREVTPTDQNTTPVSSGAWINCSHSDGPKPVKSRFATCDEAHTGQGNGSTSISSLSRTQETSPGWMECESSGCCTAGAASFTH